MSIHTHIPVTIYSAKAFFLLSLCHKLCLMIFVLCPKWVFTHGPKTNVAAMLFPLGALSAFVLYGVSLCVCIYKTANGYLGKKPHLASSIYEMDKILRTQQLPRALSIVKQEQ